jgi:hypothetical protein|tara:strand:+ start:17781 stop:19670 length:1890 start_codon:yes stop_codon:yes gene_type:complete
MAIKYLSHLETLNIDLQQNELQNAVIHKLTTATRPATPVEGQIIYNSTDKALEIWNGTAWVNAAGDITAVSAGVGLTGGGTQGAVTLNVDYAGTDNFILAATDDSGAAIETGDFIIYSDGATDAVKHAYVGDLPFTDNLGTVTSVGVSGTGGITVADSPVTTSGVIALGLSNIPNSSLANSAVTVTAGAGLQDGGTVSLGGTITLNVDYAGTDNVILATADKSGVTIKDEWKILVSNDESAADYYSVSDLPFNAFTGVTSVAVTGSDGIDVDSGSPITTNGTIALGLSNVPNSSLANSGVTYGSTTVALGGTSTSIAGLTGLDFTAADAAIASSIGANKLTLGGALSTVVVAGNLTVKGTVTQVDSTEVNIGDAIIKLNANEVGVPSQNSGFEVERGTSANVSLLWDESGDRWDFGASYDVRANAFIGDLEGNADTASAWETARKITLAGDATGSVTLNGSADVTLTATVTASGVAPNSVALGTDTTGDYVKTVSAGVGIDVSAGGEGAVVTVTAETATVTNAGIAELATSAETITGTDTARTVTPKGASDLVAARQAAVRFCKDFTAGETEYIVNHELEAECIIAQVWNAKTKEMLSVAMVQTDVNTLTLKLDKPSPFDLQVAIIKIS